MISNFFSSSEISRKVALFLKIFLFFFLFLFFRVWQLTVIQHETKSAEAKRPQKKTIIEAAKRGTIRDRFNLPVAINKVQYDASILYSQIRQIPVVAYEKSDGRVVKCFKRREYVGKLSCLLAKELSLDPDRIEDLIYAKAALYNHLPFSLKKGIGEREYYRLKMLERQWPGIFVQQVPKREYPNKKTAGDIVGYIGPIRKEQYEAIVQEIRWLEEKIASLKKGGVSSLSEEEGSLEELEEKLKLLLEKSYSLNDQIGRSGIEERFESVLRGRFGKRLFYSDAKGNFLKELPEGKRPVAGQRLILTLSLELQEFAEKLLILSEKMVRSRISTNEGNLSHWDEEKTPWIRGGAIVAMDPNSGEILALASNPRFDPNDLLSSHEQKPHFEKVHRWLETEEAVGAIWNGKQYLERERVDSLLGEVSVERLFLTWNRYLALILPNKSPLRKILERGTIKDAVKLQRGVQELQELTSQNNLPALLGKLYKEGENHLADLPLLERERLEENFKKHSSEIKSIKKKLDPYLVPLTHNFERVLLMDLCRLVLKEEKFSEKLLDKIGGRFLSFYREQEMAWSLLEKEVREKARELFQLHHFKPWRKKNQREFLKMQRLEEKKQKKKYPTPFIDLLDRKEKEMFETFWLKYHQELFFAFFLDRFSVQDPTLWPYFDQFLAWRHDLEEFESSSALTKAFFKIKKTIEDLPLELVDEYLASFRNFKDLERPLMGKYHCLRKDKQGQKEKHLAAAFYPTWGWGYSRSYAYRQAAVQGSIFKFVTAYQALLQRYLEFNGKVTDYNLLNPYEMDDRPFQSNGEWFVGFDRRGNPIPQFYKGGRLPRSTHSKNIGTVDLLKAVEMSSNPYFSLLAKEVLKSPEDLKEAAFQFSYGKKTGIDLPGEISGQLPSDLSTNVSGLYATAIGQHTLSVTPLQTAVMLSTLVNGGKVLKPNIVKLIAGKDDANQKNSKETPFLVPFATEVKRRIDLPRAVRTILLKGFNSAIKRVYHAVPYTLAHLYRDDPKAIQDFINLKGQFVGKSSTSESYEALNLSLKPSLCNHIWFGGISFEKELTSQTSFSVDEEGKPELVVVIYLRFGAWGKDLAPLTAQIVQKWREIKKKHGVT